jgi:hypothetical protein
MTEGILRLQIESEVDEHETDGLHVPFVDKHESELAHVSQVPVELYQVAPRREPK